MSSIVYALTNPAMPNLVKIGRTTKETPDVRMNQLYTTGIPLPFECVIAIELGDEDANKLERALHIAFSPHRKNPQREFFDIEVGQIAPLLEAFPGRNVTPRVNKESDDELDPIVREAVKSIKRRPNFNFHEMNVPSGSILTSLETGEKITVTGPKTIRYKDEEMSLTRATKEVLKVDYRVAPTLHWLFEGKKLRDIYLDTYEKEPVSSEDEILEAAGTSQE